MTKRTKYVSFSGKSKWAKLETPDTKFTPEGKWSINLYLTPEGVNQVLELKKEGLRNVIKKDDEGTFVTWSRMCQKMIKGRIKAFDPPKIEDRDGIPLPRSTKIGNGSDVTVTVEVYYFTTPQKIEACAARLDTIRIENLIPYSRDEYTDKDLRAVKSLDNTPAQPMF